MMTRLSLRALALALPALLAGVEGLGQDLCSGLVTDKKPHPMTALAKPGVGKTVTDPEFGTTIRRITDAGTGNAIKPMYSTIQAWNADETYLILYQQGSGHRLYDGKTYKFIRRLKIKPADIEQVYWHTTDPDILFYVSGKDFIRYHVSKGKKETLTTFDFCSKRAGTGHPKGMSWDSKRIGVRCGSERFIYDISTNSVVSRKTMKGSATQVAPSGNLAFHVDEKRDARVLDANLDKVRSLDLGNAWEHSMLGKTSDGHDAHFSVAFDRGPGGSDVGSLVVHDMTNGKSRVIVGPSTGYPYPRSMTHVSATAHKRPGWAVVSGVAKLDGQGVLDNELFLADTAPGGSVCRVAHHRSHGKPGSMGYWAEPHPVLSPSGTRILFGSDWGNSGSVDSYVVELPSYDGSVPPER